MVDIPEFLELDPTDIRIYLTDVYIGANSEKSHYRICLSRSGYEVFVQFGGELDHGINTDTIERHLGALQCIAEAKLRQGRTREYMGPGGAATIIDIGPEDIALLQGL